MSEFSLRFPVRIQIVFIALIFSALTLRPGTVLADSIAIPTVAIGLKNKDFPAADLLYDGEPLDPDAAADLRKNGLDLSRLDPAPSDVWQNASYSASDEDQRHYPEDGARLNFHSIMLENPEGWFRSQVISGDQMFRLVLSLNTHQALMRAALLRKIGYPVQSPKWFSRVVLSFPDKRTKDHFVGEISTQAGLVDHQRWVISNDDSKNELVLQDIMLEPATIVVPTSFYMGNLNATHIEERRVLRSLLIPFVLADVPESINMYSWEPAQVVSGNVVLTHKYADAFSETTYDDCRWILARIARLSREDWREIVGAGKYPSDIAALLLEKSIARRNRMLAHFNLHDQTADIHMRLPYNPKLTTGFVEEGKVLRETYPGYALRFTHGDPQSPLQTDEVVRFIKIEAITTGIKQLTSMINEKLQILTMDSLQEKRMEQLTRNLFDHIKKNPFEPYSQPISTWHGPTGSVALSASRNIMTGSYYGDQSSDFKVNLVDQISASARLGYFMGVDGIPKVFPGVGANVAVQRSYVHVRPIASIEAAEKKSWKELWVPGFMKNLASALDKPVTGDTPEDNLAQMRENLGRFLEDLKENEIFTITDSISLRANVDVNAPLVTLLNLQSLSFANSIGVGADANTMILRRTTFTRENGKLKIYLQNIQSRSLGGDFDFNWWMNITRLSYSGKWGQAQTRAFHLDESPSEEGSIRHTILAVRGILVKNNSEILESNFNPFELDHRTAAAIAQGKFLFFRWSNIEESHRVKVRPPRHPEHDFDPRDHERTLFSHRILKRTGRDYHTFLGDVLDGLVQKSSFFKPGILDAAAGSNPKDSFMGSAKWNVTTTEAEVTHGRESSPVSISENYWAGWDLSKANLFKVLDQIDAKLRSLDLNLPLVDREVFNDMKRLQLYEVRTTFIVYEEGMEKLRRHLLAKSGKKAGLFRRLAGWDDFSGTDKDVVYKVLVPLVGGDSAFKKICEERVKHKEKISGVKRTASTGYIVRGQTYPCLLPWMNKILDMRRNFPKGREDQVKWTTRLLTTLEQNVDLGHLMKWIGEDHFFFQVKISGFRTRDENGDTADYTSSTIGTFSNRDRAGIFRDFAAEYEIMSSELNATYLSEGY